MTSHGGGSDRGVIFKINTDGTGYKNIHNFTGTNLDGRKPYGSLVVKGSIVYGMTNFGGKPTAG